jgi:beta-lactamase regulating signal transducer with metallopeptidase domain
MNFLTYLLQSAACAAMLWLAYYLLVRKETCYVFNRFYLLAIIPVSIVAPLLQFPLWPAVETAAFTPIFDIENIIASAAQPVTENVETTATTAIVAVKAFPTAALLLAMYGLGAAYLLTRFGRRLYKLYRFSVENSFKDKGCGNAFTFFRKIYINRETFNPEDYAKILLHEQTHAQQLHSLDLVLAELFAVFQFFNPFAWLLKKSLAEAHEYYADAQVLARYPETNKYQQLLYDQAIGLCPEYVSGFNYSLTKKRLIMMTKTKRSHWLFAKLLGLLVITTVFIVAQVGCKQARAVQNSEKQQTENAEDSQLTPEFIGSSNIMEYLGYNLKYPEEAIKAGVNIRVVYSFVVETDSTVTNIKWVTTHIERDSENPEVIAAWKACEKVAYEIIESTSTMWRPAQKDDMPVRAEMSLPIWFKFH